MTALPSTAKAPDAPQLIAEAAHEIRTPLGGILALADLLLAEDLTEIARGHATALKTAAEHLLGVATTLLGNAGSGRSEILDIDAFLSRAAPPLVARAALKGLTFRTRRAPGVPDRVLADESALWQIVDNLADNALRATDDGSIELAIERLEGDAASVTLRVALRDTGPGLGDEPDRLFEPYVQGDRAQGAAGLGLSVVARLAERMGGRAEAANLPRGGAEVAVVVKLGAVEAPTVQPAGRALKILVAEDNAVNQRVIATLLDHFGHSYDIVGDGDAAISRARTGAYDLVMMDAVMPRRDGLEATRAIRAFAGPAGQVRIVGVTARAFDHEIKAFRAAGADAVVTKPLSVAELWRAIDAGDERRKAG
ncbi:response regulator [Hansschlegelia plantiphila]|uniref:histidine kinase n=1 Tax=Hansschlegelia plantiphila TaxID=374655 RepID=A0A9W6IWL2_9HYPH|nr:response regulator [Hansschlegelia plantiphila]GLK66480.1 hybrid sensor histidine kinase/response regulator [Hansschlegelia plantiphila]